MKYLPQACVFEHLVPSLRCCLGKPSIPFRRWNLAEVCVGLGSSLRWDEKENIKGTRERKESLTPGPAFSFSLAESQECHPSKQNQPSQTHCEDAPFLKGSFSLHIQEHKPSYLLLFWLPPLIPLPVVMLDFPSLWAELSLTSS